MAAALLSVTAIATFLVLPLLVEGAVMTLGFSEQRVGFLSAAILAGFAGGAGCAVFWVRKIHWHRALGVALAGAAMSDSLAMAHHGAAAFMISQGCAGFFGGSAYALALTILSDGKQADRNFGFSIAAQVIFQVASLLVGPSLLVRGGINAVLAILLSLNAATLLLLPLLPAAGRPVGATSHQGRIFHSATAWALMGLFFFFINVGCYWTYIELFGAAARLNSGQIASILAAGVSLGVLGALLASGLGNRCGYLAPLALSTAGTVAAVLPLFGTLSPTLFFLSVALYNVAWNFSLAYQYATVNVVDVTGRGVAIAPVFQSAGAAAGPAVAGVLMSTHSLRVVPWLAIGSVVCSLLAFLGALRQRSSRAATARLI